MRLVIGTRKGLILLRRGAGGWSQEHLSLAGAPVTYAFEDARTGVLWAGVDHGHWGCKLHRSTDGGASFDELPAPAYPEDATVRAGGPGGSEGDRKPAVLDYIWTIEPGGIDEPEVLYMGTIPGGLFKSADGGETWQLVRSLWDSPDRGHWFGGGKDLPGIHCVRVDPRDSRRVLLGVSCGGVYETTDGGASWAVRSAGLNASFLPDPNAEVGHDPHMIDVCRDHPDRVWQQNHDGLYRSDDGGRTWVAVSTSGTHPHFGFAVAAHPTDPDTAWIVPAIGDGDRRAIDGALQVCRTRNAGATWESLRAGLPQQLAFDLVYRHGLALAPDARTLAFGTTNGNLYLSDDAGDSWQTIATSLPPVYSVRMAP